MGQGGEGMNLPDDVESYDKFFCRVAIRPEYRGRKANPGVVDNWNGRVLWMAVLWLMEEGEKYPGE